MQPDLGFIIASGVAFVAILIWVIRTSPKKRKPVEPRSLRVTKFNSPSNPVNKAVRKAGSVNRLAMELGVTRQAIYQWRQRGCMPLERAIQVEKLYGIPVVKLISPKLREIVEGE